MRNNTIRLIYVALAGLLAVQVNSFATIGPSGDWTATTISDTQTVTLTGDVNLKGLITINNGGSLTINMSDELTGDVMIKVVQSLSTRMFLVNHGGQLFINGRNDSHRIIIDGGANFSEPVYDSEGYMTNNSLGNPECSVSGPAIQNLGKSVLNYVVFQNIYNNSTNYNYFGAAIQHGSYSYSYTDNFTTLEHCIINKCVAHAGSALFLAGSSNGKVDITDSEICNCCCQNLTSAFETGGVIRSTGTVKASIYLTNVVLHNNYSSINGGAIGFFSGGTSETCLSLNGCDLYKNNTGSYGGAINCSGNLYFIGKKTLIHNNKTKSSGGGIRIGSYGSSAQPTNPVHITFDLNENVEIFNNNCDGSGGGVYFISSTITVPESSSYKLLINGANIYGNTATGNGGGIAYNNQYTGTKNYQFSVEIKSGLIDSNTSGDYGGGIYAYKAPITMTGGEIKSNYAKNGGGFYISNGNVDISGGTLYNNTATTNGGGFYVTGGSTTKVNISGTVTADNNAATNGNGGGCLVSGGTLTISNGAFTNNNATASNGGGFYVSGGNVKIFGGNIEGNNAKSGAGAYVTGGSLSVIDDTEHGTHTAKTISGNTATGNGGGFYVNGGDVTMSNASISSNHAASGAGLYSNGGSVEFTSGEVGSNIASGNGGGLFVNGGSIEFSANLDGNTAANGGGLYLASGAEMTFAGGVISKNKAVASESATATTAYHGGSGIQGCGGGIYLQSGPDATHKTTLLFDFPEGMRVMGLYSNEADKAGAEIVAEGGNTEVQLPAISEMQLAGFEGQDASPYWYQDYFTGDTGFYQSGGHAVAGDVTTVDRFKNIMKLIGTQYLEHRIPETRLPQIVNNYLCLTLSFSMLNITLKATGLLGHETAMFKLIRHGTDKDTNYDILLRADDGASKTLRNMPWGTYSVYPNNSWNYEYSPVQSKDNIRVGETDHYVIEYNMEHRNSAVMPQHDERQIGGKDVPSSSVSGSVPEKYSGKEL